VIRWGDSTNRREFAMATFFRKPDRRQRLLLPIDMLEWLPETDLVHLVLDAIDEMNLSVFEADYRTGGAGQAAFAPSMMLAVLIYAYANGHRSSRKIERLCWRDVGFRMIVGEHVPDHSVIARFRRQHTEQVEVVFVEVLRLCRAAGLGRLGVVALDGTKVAANAALAANRTAKTLDDEVRAILAEAETTDTSEDAEHGELRGDELPPNLRNREARRKRLLAAKQRLAREADEEAAAQQAKCEARAAEEAETGKRKRGRKPAPPSTDIDPEAKANPTDPDSGIMKTAKGWLQGYNAQAMVSEDQIILAGRLTQEANDVHQLEPMLTAALVNLELASGEEVALGALLADAGYWSEANAEAETEEAELLIATRSAHRQRAARRDQPPPRGRMPSDLSPRQRMERKLMTKRGRDLYALRGQTVEPVFGQMKETQGADRFMVRGLTACSGEWTLHCVAHNLKKLHAHRVRRHATGRTPMLH
jgi:transposase